jgi:hypothetical protein
MKILERPPETGSNPCPACGSHAGGFGHESMQPFADASDFDRSTLLLLESENAGLRRLVVELIEKNQKLREQLDAANVRYSGSATELRLVNGRIAS